MEKSGALRGEIKVESLKRIVKYVFSDDDQEEDVNACLSGQKLALCLYLVCQRIRKEWEECDEASPMEKMIDDVEGIISEKIGSIDMYTY